jgi:hypothetical protein
MNESHDEIIKHKKINVFIIIKTKITIILGNKI